MSCAAVITIIPYYQQEIAKQLSILADQPVDFSRIKFSWRGFRVYAKVYNVDIGNVNSKVHIEHINEISLMLYPIKSLVSWEPKFDKITIIGGKVFLSYKPDLIELADQTTAFNKNKNKNKNLNFKKYLNNIFSNEYVSWLNVHKIFLKNTAVVIANQKNITEYILADIKLLQKKKNNYIYGLLYKVNSLSLKNKEREKIEFAVRYNLKNQHNDSKFYFATNSRDLLNVFHDNLEGKIDKIKHVEIDQKTEIKIWGNINNNNFQSFDLDGKLILSITSPSIKFDFTRNATGPANFINIKNLSGAIEFIPQDYSNNIDKYKLNLINFKFNLAESDFIINAGIENDSSPALINSDIKFGHIDFRRFILNLPTDILGKNTKHWLDVNLKSGWLGDAQIIWRGPLDNSFPYDLKHDKPNGVFNLRAEILNANLTYADKWPAITNMDAVVSIRGRDLTITTNKANFSNSAIEHLTANINELGAIDNNILLLSGKLKTSGDDLAKVIATTPLNNSLGAVNNKLRFNGPMNLFLGLNVGLDNNANVAVNGHLVFANNGLIIKDTPLNFDNLSGSLDFTDHSAKIEALTADFNKQQAKFKLSYDEQSKVNKDVNVSLHSAVASDYLMKYYNLDLNKYISGIAEFDLNLNIKKDRENKNNLFINIDTNLLGINTNFPQIYFNGLYNKTSAVALPAKLTINYDFKNPTKYNLKITHGAKQGNALGMDNNNIETSSFDYQDDSSWVNKTLFIDNKYFNGDLKFVKNNGKVAIDANVKKLNLILDSGNIANNSNNYFELPNISAVIDSFSFNDLLIGNVRLNTRSDKIQKLFGVYDSSISGPLFDLKIDGSYKISDTKQTNMSGTYKIKDLINTAKLFGNTTVKDKIKFEGEYNLFWLDELLNVDLKKIAGDININSGRGNISDIDIGLGRIFGFFNLQSLNKRLKLDFSDVFGKGFKFDSLKGKIDAKQGMLHTESVKIGSGSADIELYGSVDLLNKIYNLNADVTPHLTSSLPVAAAVVGTPVAGAVVFLVDKILESPVDQMSEQAYSITGPWSNPVVKKLRKKRGPLISLSWLKPETENREYKNSQVLNQDFGFDLNN